MLKNPEGIVQNRSIKEREPMMNHSAASKAELLPHIGELFQGAQNQALKVEKVNISGDALRGIQVYGEKIGASDDMMATVRENTNLTGELASIEELKRGAVLRFKEKLRKFAVGPLAGLAIMMPNVSNATETIEAPDTIGAYTQFSQEAPPEIKETVIEEEVDIAKENSKGRPIVSGMAFEDLLQNQEVSVFEGGDQRLAVEGREARDEAVLTREFLSRNFSSEEEILIFLNGIAREQKNEFVALYGVQSSGKLKVATGGFYGRNGAIVFDMNKQIDELKLSGIEKVVSVHTHPQGEADDIPATQEGDFDRMPPSLIDIRTASGVQWRDRYDNPSKDIAGEIRGGVNVEHVVVDSEGVWKYTADFFHPYIEAQRAGAIEGAMKIAERKSKNGVIDYEATENFLKAVTLPDDIVRKRVIGDMKMGVPDLDALMYVKMAGKWIDEGFGYEYTNEQVKVGKANPKEKEVATENFIRWCNERGMHISYTLFGAKKVE